ncbi:MAG: hypothetical protein JWL77_2179 [Chthonomonadaceae bacterium]|nr:hypothetical protein [Chthonomonadaceae bacterium]
MELYLDLDTMARKSVLKLLNSGRDLTLPNDPTPYPKTAFRHFAVGF